MIRYPFTAVVGQDLAKLSLIFHAIDPRLGGTLLQGHRGCAKSTLARGLKDLFPQDAPFVNIPLGVSEDRLLGSVDAERLVEASEWKESKGLIELAHEGVFYIDEVNLLPDSTSDLILDVAASGHYVMERDGFSRTIESNFVLVGSMNPDEGELRPQLYDRFAHKVWITDDYTPDERVEIVRRRMEFDDHAPHFVDAWRKETSALTEMIETARKFLSEVSISEEIRQNIADQASTYGLQGMRTEISVLRTARCSAAFAKREAIENEDLQLAWQLCGFEIPEGSSPPGPSHSTERERGGAVTQDPKTARPDDIQVNRAPGGSSSFDWWKRPSREVPQRGSHVGTVGRSIDWVRTLIEKQKQNRWQLVFRKQRSHPNGWIFIDASRSTGMSQSLGGYLSEVESLCRSVLGYRWNFLLLRKNKISWILRRGSSRAMIRELSRIESASGCSSLIEGVRTLHCHILRGGLHPKDRALLLTDGIPTVAHGLGPRKTRKKFSDQLKRLGRDLPSACFHPHARKPPLSEI